MRLYIVNYWVPFPSSEYGGVVIVTARDDEEAIAILEEQYSDSWDKKYNSSIRQAVKDAESYELDGCQKSEIAYEFLT